MNATIELDENELTALMSVALSTLQTLDKAKAESGDNFEIAEPLKKAMQKLGEAYLTTALGDMFAPVETEQS